jgi:serine/threonine-protein kinase RsbW
MIEQRRRIGLSAGPPAESGQRFGTWSLQVAPQLSKVRASIDELARRRYAHPSLDLPEPSLLGVMERLSLVVSELGGNALRHAHAPVTVSLSRLRRGWLLSVADGDPTSVPRIDDPGLVPGHRHGLEVVAIVSSDLGWYVEEDQKHVWATIPDTSPVGLSDLVQA